jgi:hypothetical protein
MIFQCQMLKNIYSFGFSNLPLKLVADKKVYYFPRINPKKPPYGSFNFSGYDHPVSERMFLFRMGADRFRFIVGIKSVS